MKIGDLVQYRNWEIGDPKIEETPPDRRGWGRIGVIVEIGTWTLGESTAPGESILMLTDEHEFVEVWKGDISVISETKNIENSWELNCDWNITEYAHSY